MAWRDAIVPACTVKLRPDFDDKCGDYLLDDPDGPGTRASAAKCFLRW